MHRFQGLPISWLGLKTKYAQIKMAPSQKESLWMYLRWGLHDTCSIGQWQYLADDGKCLWRKESRVADLFVDNAVKDLFLIISREWWLQQRPVVSRHAEYLYPTVRLFSVLQDWGDNSCLLWRVRGKHYKWETFYKCPGLKIGKAGLGILHSERWFQIPRNRRLGLIMREDSSIKLFLRRRWRVVSCSQLVTPHVT